ncbi:protein NODULATION SIGNALING PATHWAY 1 [Cornus florida]|uniref:protein NODULATION SIGNALING PATHWAY 1 n=1 Tax=Cornus florida TaxID=4283 RepID=UPI002897E542|nr:protein NODULATION SIGNALING PATHWAY 1 [Cornus florida]
MTIEEPEPNPMSDHILDWLEGSASFLPSLLDDLYNSGDINGDSWWAQGQELDQELVNKSSAPFSSTSNSTITTSTTPPDPIISYHPPPSDSSKKRKASDNPTPKASQSSRRNQNRRIPEADDGDAVVDQGVVAVRKSGGTRKATAKSAGHNCNNKEGRWAEQLLNPCAAAITAGDLTRVQHLVYVLRELASSTGDANHRLADHGLRALTYYLSSSASSASVGPITFASTKPQFFQNSLLRFYDVSPWFIFHNNIANASILQILSEQDRSRNLHIIDIGVSHGKQWPTLLEALTRRSGGPPPLVRLTVVSSTIDNDQTTDTPFAVGPQGDNYVSRLLCFAKTMNINLQINRVDNHPLQNLNAQIINSSPDETLIVCTQFRLHHLNHSNPDNRTEFMKVLRGLKPKGVVLSENNMDCSCNSCGDFVTGFSRRVEYLWRFLDSTSVAFKGRESEERRVMEGEAAKALTNTGEMNEGKEKWCERMRGVGFVGEVFVEDTIDGARALLRKYDSNWEMRVEERDGCVGLWWKGQPVSFCSLWKLDMKADDS